MHRMSTIVCFAAVYPVVSGRTGLQLPAMTAYTWALDCHHHEAFLAWHEATSAVSPVPVSPFVDRVAVGASAVTLPLKGQTVMTHNAIAKSATNSTMQLARTSSGVRPAVTIRHNLAEPETAHSEAPVTIDYLEGFHRSA